MHAQDALLAIFFLLQGTTVLVGVLGPNHKPAHLLLIIAALLLPFASFDAARLGEVPAEAWLFCAFYVAVQVIHTGYHYLWKSANHASGPEILFQPVVCMWVVSLRGSLDPSLWYRGTLGVFTFVLGTVFLMLGVLMLTYISEGTSIPGDDIDLRRDPWHSRGNTGFLVAVASASMVTLWVVDRSPLWLAGAAAAFTAVKLLLGARRRAAAARLLPVPPAATAALAVGAASRGAGAR